MNTSKTISGTVQAWDDGTLGESEAHVRKVSLATEQAIDDALSLQAISIRIPKGVIEAYKTVAALHGVGYQPLMRDAMCRWIEAEMKQLSVASAPPQKPEARATDENAAVRAAQRRTA